MITLKQLMIKELSLAVFFGLLIGLGLTGTFYFLRQQSTSTVNQVLITSPTPVNNSTLQKTPSPASTNNTDSSQSLNISSPQNNDIVATSKINLKGQSSPQANIIIVTLNKNYYLIADINGAFNQDIDLEPGLNNLKITSVDSKDQENHIELSLTYSTIKLE